MAVRLIQCPTCGATYRTEDYAANRRYRCPTCNCKFMVQGDDASDELIGRVIGGCRIVAKIGEGGMGRIYKATHEALKKRVAIKILPGEFASNERYVTRFQREARSAARVEHPNIVSVLNVGEDQGYHFIVMQYIEGTDLDTIVKQRGRLMSDEALRIIEQVANGLLEIEKTGLIHRDIKPSNIMVTGSGHVFIADFGLARSVVERDDGTPSGKVVGTPYYMSPEQCEGRNADIRGDIYALGATLYYLLTGRKPFEGDTNQVVIYKHRFVDLIPPDTVYSDIPQSLSHMVCRMMAKKPDDRYEGVEPLLNDLRRVQQEIQFDTAAAVSRLGQMVPAALTGSTTVIIPTATRSKRWAMPATVAAIVAGIALLALIVALAIPSRPDETPLAFDMQWRHTLEAIDGMRPSFYSLSVTPPDRRICAVYSAPAGGESAVRVLRSDATSSGSGRTYRGLPPRVRALTNDSLAMADGRARSDFTGLAERDGRMELFKYKEGEEIASQPLDREGADTVGLPPYTLVAGFFQRGAGERQVLYAHYNYYRTPRTEKSVVGLGFSPQGAHWQIAQHGAVHVSPWEDTVEGRPASHILLVKNGMVEQINPVNGASRAWGHGTVPPLLDSTQGFVIEYAYVLDMGRRVSPEKRVLYLARSGEVDDRTTSYMLRHEGKTYMREAVAYTRMFLFLATLDGQILPGWQRGVPIPWAVDAQPVVLSADVDSTGDNDIVINPGPDMDTFIVRASGFIAASERLGRLLGVDRVSATRRDLLFADSASTLTRYRLKPQE